LSQGLKTLFKSKSWVANIHSFDEIEQFG